MKISDKISKRIEQIPEDLPFGYDLLDISKEEYLNAAKILERLQKKGVIKKLSKGVFYRPKMTVFGELVPKQEDLIKPYLYENGLRIAYITGGYLYNQLGLTTQMSFKLRIASQDKRIYINRGSIVAKPVKSYAKVTDENYTILGFLDAMKDLKKIPDVDIENAIVFFKTYLQQKNEIEIKELVKYALLYPPRVQALLGAVLESIKKIKELSLLKANLNPLSEFNLGIKNEYLRTTNNWNINQDYK